MQGGTHSKKEESLGDSKNRGEAKFSRKRKPYHDSRKGEKKKTFQRDSVQIPHRGKHTRGKNRSAKTIGTKIGNPAAGKGANTCHKGALRKIFEGSQKRSKSS